MYKTVQINSLFYRVHGFYKSDLVFFCFIWAVNHSKVYFH